MFSNLVNNLQNNIFLISCLDTNNGNTTVNVTVDQGSNPCQGKTTLLWIILSVQFFTSSYCKCFSFCVVLFMCIFFLSLCFVVLVYPSFLLFSCVLSRFCHVFGFCHFLNNPFTLFLRYLNNPFTLFLRYLNNPFTLFLRYSVANISLLGNFHQKHFSADIIFKSIIISDTLFIKII